MSCECSTTTVSSDCSRLYMRIDGVIFNKKHVKRLEFDGLKLHIWYNGECSPYSFDLWSEKTNAQIANYLLELNSCGSAQQDMSIDNHANLINLDVENQHPISAIINLQSALSNLALKRIERIATEGQTVFNLDTDLTNKNPLVFINGSLQISTGYTLATTSITFSTPLSLGSKVIIIYNF